MSTLRDIPQRTEKGRPKASITCRQPTQACGRETSRLQVLPWHTKKVWATSTGAGISSFGPCNRSRQHSSGLNVRSGCRKIRETPRLLRRVAGRFNHTFLAGFRWFLSPVAPPVWGGEVGIDGGTGVGRTDISLQSWGSGPKAFVTRPDLPP